MSPLRRSKYRDVDGLWWAVLLPDDVPDSQASTGIEIGPPLMDALGLEPAVAAALHNELFIRNLLTVEDVERRPGDVVDALRAAFRVDVPRIAAIYRGTGDSGAILAPEG